MGSKDKLNILVFVPGDFDEVFVKKVLLPLSQTNGIKMYVINRPVDLVIDPLKGFKRLRKSFLNRNIRKDGVNIFLPFVLLNEVIHESLCNWCNINMKILIWQVKRLIKKEKIESQKLLLWCYHPFHWKVMEEIPAKRKIYEVYDEYCYDQKDRLRINVYNAERKMVLFSDEIICSSEKLREKFQKIVPIEKNLHLISTSADYRSFLECSVRKYSPWDIIPKPKLVILGAVRHQTDLMLVEELALKIPKVSIVFIGNVLNCKYKNKEFKRLLEEYQNIYHTGFLSYDKVIYCLRSATIGLYPAKKCRFSTYANPNRIYEYSAAGIPVVAINISRESDFPKSIVVAKYDTEFITAVETLVRNGITEHDKEELIKFAKKHSATENVKRYIEVFQNALSG